MSNPRVLRGLLILAPILVAYFSALSFPFLAITDDEANLRVSKSLFDIWTEPTVGLYIPMFYTVLYFVKLNLLHGLNILLHGCNALLVYRILKKHHTWPAMAMVGALVFALHPVQVESVAWITGLKDVMSAFFALAALNLYLDGKGRWFVFLGILAMLSKPSAICIGLIALAYHRRWSPIVLLFFGAIITVVSTQSQFMPTWNLRNIAIGFDSLGFYIASLNPFGFFGSDYGRYGADWRFVLIALGFVVWALYRKQLWMIIFCLALLPTLGFIPFAQMDTTQVTDRYMYLAMFGVAVGVTLRPGFLVPVALIAGFMVTCNQVERWKDVRTLYTHNLRDDHYQLKPNTYMVLAIDEFRQGNTEKAIDYKYMAKNAYDERKLTFWR